MSDDSLGLLVEVPHYHHVHQEGFAGVFRLALE
jgi:hypothetical protein